MFFTKIDFVKKQLFYKIIFFVRKLIFYVKKMFFYTKHFCNKAAFYVKMPISVNYVLFVILCLFTHT